MPLKWTRKKTHPWIALICLLAYGVPALAGPWSPRVSFDDQNTGDLVLKIHPDSPSSCGIDIIEVGTQKSGQAFDPHFALLRDRYDASYPGISPKIRRLYSYNIRPLDHSEGPALPGKQDRRKAEKRPAPADVSVVLDTDTVRRDILSYLVYDLAKIVAVAASGIAGQAMLVTLDHFVDSYLKSRDYQRTRALYTLRLMSEIHHPAMKGIVSPEEVQRLLAYGSQSSQLTGLLLSDDYVKLIAQGEDNERREARTRNFSNLLSAINREGLVAQPLFRDFVLVYYDPSRPTAHPVDLNYTDILESPEQQALKKRSALKNGLIPLGLYTIDNPDDRVLTADFSDPSRMDRRTTVKLLTDLGTSYTMAFLPFPFSIGIFATHQGAKFVLNKAGRDILSDTLQDEAELIALLDSGVANLDPELIKEVRTDMGMASDNIFLKLDPGQRSYRTENARQMTKMLKENGAKLCRSIKKLRESEFRSEYLSLGERMDRSWSKIMSWIGAGSNASYQKERKELIQERTPLVEARKILRTYDPATSTASTESLIGALQQIGQAQDPSDVEWIRRILKYNPDTDVLNEALMAAGAHGGGDLDDALADYLSTFDFTQDLPDTRGATEALRAIPKIKLETASHPEITYGHLSPVLRSLHSCPNTEIYALANAALASLQKQYLDLPVSEMRKR